MEKDDKNLEFRMSLRTHFIEEDLDELESTIDDEIDGAALPKPEGLKIVGDNLVIELFDRTKEIAPTYNIGSYSQKGNKTYTLPFENIISIRVLAANSDNSLAKKQHTFEEYDKYIPIGKPIKWNWYDHVSEFETIPPHIFQLYILPEDVILDDIEAQSNVDNWLNKLNEENPN